MFRRRNLFSHIFLQTAISGVGIGVHHMRFGACFSTVTDVEGQPHPLYPWGAQQWFSYSAWNCFHLDPPRFTFGRHRTPVLSLWSQRLALFSRSIHHFKVEQLRSMASK